MIEGLKVTVTGTELTKLCIKCAEHHRRRAADYAKQMTSLKAAKVEGLSQSSRRDPIDDLRVSAENHDAAADEMYFIAEHLVSTETYQLDSDAMHKLGIAKSRW